MDRFANNGTWEWNNSIPLIPSIFCIFSRPSCCYFCQLYSQTWKRYVDRILIKDSRGKAVDPTTKVWRNNIRKNCKESQKGKGGNQRSSIGTSVSSVIIIIIIKSEYIIYIIYSYILLEMICPVAAAESFDGIEAGRKEVNPAAVLAKYCKIFSVIIVFLDKSSFQVKWSNSSTRCLSPLLPWEKPSFPWQGAGFLLLIIPDRN